MTITKKRRSTVWGWAKLKILSCMAVLIGFMGLSGAEFAFAENGKAQCLIALPDKPAGFEQDAADDLQTYLGKMTGAEFTVLPESKVPAGKSVIYVGQTDFARKQKIRFDQLTAEEWVIRPAGNNLILSGGKPIGSFYAVWNLLNQFGCYCLTWDQDAVPSCKVLRREIRPEQKKPAFQGRFIYNRYPSILRITQASDQVIQSFAKWKLRNGQNGRHNSSDNQWVYSAHYIPHYPSAHSLSLYVNPELFKTHPEYFSMNEAGKRFPPRKFAYGGSLCMANPKVAEVTLDSLRKMIRKDRETRPQEKWPTVYDISTLDGISYICKCPDCRAVIKEEGSQSGLLLRYINSVAKEIKKEYPDVFIRTFCYGYSTGTPPKKVRPESNVLVQLCDKFSLSVPFRPLSDPINAGHSLAGTRYFNEWSKLASRIMAWDYWNIGRNPHPDTVFDALQSDFRYFRDLNVTDIFIEAERNPHSPQSFIDLSYFVASQLMMDMEKDPETLADIYFQYYYGPAAKEMRKLFEDIREGMRQQKTPQTSKAQNHWAYLTPDFIYSHYVKLKKLSESFPQGNIYRKRINAERLPFLWYTLARRDSYRKVFQEHGINVNDLVPEWRALVDEYLRRYPCKKPYERSGFEEAFSRIEPNLPRPEKFKSIPDKDFRLVAWPDFKGNITHYSSVVGDPDSITGKALKSANPAAAYHGANKRYPGSNAKTTMFIWKNQKYPEKVQLLIRKVPQDEKYHWYRFPGKLELKDNLSIFYGHGGQAINVITSHLFDFVNSSPEANTWEAWFSAKFTGPAYVKGSTKENAIYIDMLVLSREVKKKMKLITLGSGAGFPSMTRNNASSYLETPHGGYLIDAGAPVAASLIRKKIDFNGIRAVFLTHQHEDHFGGLPGFLKNRMRGNARESPQWRGFWPEVWLPTQEAVTAFDRLMEIQFHGTGKDQILYRVIKPGLFYDDGYLKVTAIPNRHMPRKDGFWPSYCFLLEAEGKKLVCTGDLSKDCSDFPVEAAEDADLVLCELTHFHPDAGMPYFQRIHPGKLVFNHVAERYEKMFPDFSKQLDYPAAVAHDGDEFEF